MIYEPDFPSLLVTADRLEAQGAFAEAQRAVLDPDPETVKDLGQLLRATGIGVVAHYYMAPEIQGALLACDWPHINISDSLVMADKAVQMAATGVKGILVLGVDFMSENVRSLLMHRATVSFRCCARLDPPSAAHWQKLQSLPLISVI